MSPIHSLTRTRRASNVAAAIASTVALSALLTACAETDEETPLTPDTPAAFARGGAGNNNGRILIQSMRDELTAAEVYSLNPDGTGVSRLTNSPGDDGSATWSPDGKRIAFASLRHDANGEIYVMNADGSGVTRLTNSAGFDLEPRWSKDGKRIVFVSARASADPPNADLTDMDVFIMNADGSGVTQLTSTPNLAELDPDWSPDGKSILFASDRHSPGLSLEIYSMNVDGSNVTRLTFENGVARLPVWSPGSKEIAFALSTGIYKMNADGTQLTLLSSGQQELLPFWSDDGKFIAFGSIRDGNPEVYVMNADGSGQTRITNSAGDDYPTGWRR